MGFIAIKKDEIERFMAFLQYTEVAPAGAERVFERVGTQRPEFRVRIFTSLSVGAEEVRQVGSDAIRVVLLHQKDPNDPTTARGVKTETVARAGKCVKDIFLRVRDRIREVGLLAADMAPCDKCGGVCYAGGGNCIDPECRKKNGSKPFRPGAKPARRPVRRASR